MTTQPSPRAVIESYWKVECERDVEAVLDHYHADAVLQRPGSVLQGRDQIRTFYADTVRDYPGLEIRIVHEISNGDEGAFEWEAVLVDHSGRRFPLKGVNVVKVEGGKFRSVHVYSDPLPG